MRADLTSMKPEVLAQLTNAGLVKRAQRELAAGYRPEWILQGDGTLEGKFPDGVITCMPAGKSLRDCPCSCGSVAVCRHRVGLVLCYQEEGAGDTAEDHWKPPSEITDEALRAVVPRALWDSAARLERTHLVAQVECADGKHPVVTVRLSMATVQFMAGADLGLARCDCRLAGSCEHLVLAVRAARQAEFGPTVVGTQRVELGTRPESTNEGWPALEALLDSVIEYGMASGPVRHGQALSAALNEAGERRATWLILALQDLEDWLTGMAERSARVSLLDGVRLLAEIEARRRAARGHGLLSAREVMGLDEPMETELTKTRLVSLGCRVTEEGTNFVARVGLVDPDTGTRLVVRHVWPCSEPGADAMVDRVRVAPGVRLKELATGQLIGTRLRRRADGEVRLGVTHAGKFSLTPQSGDWSQLLGGRVIRDVHAWAEELTQRPPNILRSRDGLGTFVIVVVSEVVALSYEPASQTLSVLCVDAVGNEFVVAREHSSTNSHALDSLALLSRGAKGEVLFVAGVVVAGGGRIMIEPWSVATTQGVYAPDAANADCAAGLQGIPLSREMESVDRIAEAVREVGDLMAQVLETGWRTSGRNRHDRVARAGADLASLGLGIPRTICESIGDYRGASSYGRRSASNDFLQLSVWWMLAEENLLRVG